ncbi:MAG: HlyC/CorC family transporter [Bacteroidales bacterium]|nr:HlyC/CorC family transporter [Bacteroidales bacterium]
MELLVIALLLLCNGVFAMYEIALVSARKSRLGEEAKFGSMGAKTALDLLKEPEKILSAIQVGITLIGIVAGAYGGITISEDVAPWFTHIPLLAPYADTIAVILVVGFITYFSLIIGELVPKTIALNNPENIAMFLSPAMRILGAITYPVVWLLSVSTKIVIKVTGIKQKKEAPVTEEELRILLKLSSELGIIEKEESQIISEVIRFGEKNARMMMTHRVDLEWIDISKSNDEMIEKALASSFSKMPACDGSVDEVKGVIAVKDLLTEYINNKNFTVEDIIVEPFFIPAQVSAPKALEFLRTSKKHFGFVIDEYGTLEGIITLHDVTENIIGDLPALEHDNEPEFIRRSDGSYLVDGSMGIEDLRDLLSIRSFLGDEDEETGINTAGGLAMHILGHIPVAGDRFTLKGYLFEIMDMDGNRVDKILITLLR